MNKLRVGKIMLSISACWAAMDAELGLPMNRKLRLLDSFTLLWSSVIFLTSSAKFLAKDLSLNVTRGANFKPSNEPKLFDLLTINYLPRINEFEKLYYGLVSVSISTSLFWRLYLRFYRPRANLFNVDKQPPHDDNHNDAKRSLMRFLSKGPPIVVTAAASPEVDTCKVMKRETTGAKIAKSAESCSILSSVAHLQWLKVFECRQVIKDLAGCSEEFVRSFRLDSSEIVIARRTNLLSMVHEKINPTNHTYSMAPSPPPPPPPPPPEAVQPKEAEREQDDLFMNPVRSHNFFHDQSWPRWNYVARNLRYMLLITASMTVPLLYLTIVGLYSVMRNFSYERRDTWTKSALFYYGVMEQVYACSQAGVFFIFTNIFITIFHADILYRINAIRLDLCDTIETFKLADQQAPKMLIYYIQFRLWAVFDYIKQVDDFLSKYAVVSVSLFIIGLSFGQSFLRVQEPALKLGTAAVMFSNFLSFTFLYAISWDIERRTSCMHSTLVSIASRDCDLIIKRLWLKTLFGFFERDARRTFTLANKYPLNLHSWFKNPHEQTVFGWLTMSLLINRLFHKDSWESLSTNVGS